MKNPSNNIDSQGWTWIFRKNKVSCAKPIGNPFHKDLDKVASSFYVSNFPDSIDSKGLWNICAPYGRLVDVFIANKRSKRGKRFGFIRFMGVKDVNAFVTSLSNIWIENFHLYVTVARFQRPTTSRPKLNYKSYDAHNVHLGAREVNPNPKNTLIYNNTSNGKPSFTSVVHGNSKPSSESSTSTKTRSLSLNEQDLISVEDSSRVDERLIWVEISGLPLCAWGSNAFKKVACLFGKFMFFEVEESTAMSSGRVCISTKSQHLVSKNVQVEIHGETFDIQVHEIGTWSINIVDESLNLPASDDKNKPEYPVDLNDTNSVDDLDDT
ncbi:RNA-directed DNA polymerase, eukaryota, reverse transcriptase zinc-binding domain protein [Tanacetum coccineum]